MMWLLDHPNLVIAVEVVLAILFVACVAGLTENWIRSYQDELDSELDSNERVR